MAENIPSRPRRGQDRRPTVVKTPPAPTHLSGRSRKLWSEIVEQWHIDAATLPILEAALRQLDTHDRAMKILEDEGLVLVNPKSGALKPHPAAGLARESLTAYRLAMRHLGLEPGDT